MSAVSTTVAGLRWWVHANPRLAHARAMGTLDPVAFATCPVCWTDTILGFQGSAWIGSGSASGEAAGTWACRACRRAMLRAELVANAVRVATWRMLAARQRARFERPWISTHGGYCATPLGTGCTRRSTYNGRMSRMIRLDRYF